MTWARRSRSTSAPTIFSSFTKFAVKTETVAVRRHVIDVLRFVVGLAARMAPAWRDATLLVQPATILRWHRAGLTRVLVATLSAVGSTPTARAVLVREMVGGDIHHVRVTNR